jgi:hypothetical protein
MVAIVAIGTAVPIELGSARRCSECPTTKAKAASEGTSG